MVAEMARDVAAARALTRQAAAAKDRGEPIAESSRRSRSGRPRTPRCASRRTPSSCSGRAAIRARPGIERLMRDAKGAQIYEGTNQIHRGIVADSVFEGLPPE